ncbi:DUF488 family protein [Brevundimonas sp. LF-1]|uniref:DUF488 domain-containing protein n=1 Tax=Brevundimonas sp. LF-1 TaxID=3126100 RepID=UPI0030DEE8DF
MTQTFYTIGHSNRSFEEFVGLLQESQIRRARVGGLADDVNGLWRNRSFHNYADYALSQAFVEGLESLIETGRRERCAVMCAEAVWWRCHRRLIADNLLARGATVLHIMGRGRLEPARLTTGARVDLEGTVVYPAFARPG